MQRAFRTVMNAFAQPGTIAELRDDAVDAAGARDPLMTLVRLFVDQAVTFYCCDDALAERIAVETKARRASQSEALFVVVPAAASACEAGVGEASAGTLVSPEKGATVFVECGRVSATPDEGLAGFEVQGPGVRDVNRFWTDSDEWERVREGRCDEYPLGIEMILVDGEGRLAAVPRSSSVTRMEGGR
ncbi:phosphonate C-P lyase system protein PhnH [Slackia faecicanis]|nr:phosphonate C-P lyase system protein PhnH [Slackia faecicanis]